MNILRRSIGRFFEILFLLFVFHPLLADAATITKVQGKAVLIDLGSSHAQPGDQFFAVDGNGKKKAIVEISKAKGSKAIGKINKGHAEAGFALEKKSGGGGGGGDEGAGSSERTSSGGGGGKRKKFAFGVMAGYGMDSMTVKLTNATKTASENSTMTGSGFSAQVLMDMDLFSIVSARALIGMDKFSVTGKSNSGYCSGGTNCKVDITYIAADFWARLLFVNSSTRVWLGGGAGVLLPSSSTTTALDSSSIGTTATILAGGGLDLGMGKMALPIQAEYVMFPSSEDVKASAIRVKLGLIF